MGRDLSEALADVANLRSDLRDEIALVRGALEEMDALASAVHEGRGAHETDSRARNAASERAWYFCGFCV